MEFLNEKTRLVSYGEKGEVLAEIDFPRINENTVNINHTFVDESLRGKGIAGQLMKETVKYLEEQGLKALPTCRYAVDWFARHREYEYLLLENGEKKEQQD